MEQTDFAWAVRGLKNGRKFARQGWNGKGMWIAVQSPDARGMRPYIYMSAVDGMLVPWVASQSDLLAEDWTEVA